MTQIPPKYDHDPGDPLDILAEEASEIIKEVMKIKRFGLKGMPEWFAATGKTPRDYVVQEIGDLLYIVQILAARGFHEEYEIDEAIDRKRVRMLELYGTARVEKFEGKT